MSATLSRRMFVAGAAALPLLGRANAATRAPGILTFGLSSYPPSIQPWQNTGTAAGTVKLMIHRGLMSYDRDGKLRPELAESYAQDGATAWLFRLRNAMFHNGEPVTSADETSRSKLAIEFPRLAHVLADDTACPRVSVRPLDELCEISHNSSWFEKLTSRDPQAGKRGSKIDFPGLSDRAARRTGERLFLAHKWESAMQPWPRRLAASAEQR